GDGQGQGSRAAGRASSAPATWPAAISARCSPATAVRAGQRSVSGERDMMTPEKILYETEATATGGRDGKAASADGLLSVSLSLPKSLGGPGGEGTNPEQLLRPAMPRAFLAPSSSWRAPGRSCRPLSPP